MHLRRIIDLASIDRSDVTAEVRLVMPSGPLKHVRLAAHRATGGDQESLAFVGAVTDITDRKRGEQRQAAQFGISRILAQSDSLVAAAPELLRTICEAMDWDWAALWSVGRQPERLRCDCIWHASSLDSAEFDAVSREIAWAPGQGRAAQVWQTRQPLWIADATKDPGFRRGAVAARAGLHTFVACPILLGGEALGIVEFFSGATRQPDRHELATLAAIGSQIGQFVQRVRSEQALQASENRFRALIEHSYDVVLLTTAEGTALCQPLGRKSAGLCSGRAQRAQHIRSCSSRSSSPSSQPIHAIEAATGGRHHGRAPAAPQGRIISLG